MSIAASLPVPARVRALEQRMVQKIREYGSPELVANLAVLETIIQSPRRWRQARASGMSWLPPPPNTIS